MDQNQKTFFGLICLSCPLLYLWDSDDLLKWFSPWQSKHILPRAGHLLLSSCLRKHTLHCVSTSALFVWWFSSPFFFNRLLYFTSFLHFHNCKGLNEATQVMGACICLLCYFSNHSSKSSSTCHHICRFFSFFEIPDFVNRSRSGSSIIAFCRNLLSRTPITKASFTASLELYKSYDARRGGVSGMCHRGVSRGEGGAEPDVIWHFSKNILWCYHSLN